MIKATGVYMIIVKNVYACIMARSTSNNNIRRVLDKITIATQWSALDLNELITMLQICFIHLCSPYSFEDIFIMSL